MMRFVLLTLFFVSHVCAETPIYNFLFVVDSSHSMLSRKAATVQLVREMIRSGFQGQTMPGDIIDCWTFNTELKNETFPPRTWNPARAALEAEVTALYLEEEKFEGRTRFLSVSSALNEWITKQTEALVFIMTDGEDPVVGLPFDIEINQTIAAYKKGRPSKRPLLISMAVHEGHVAEWRIHRGEGELQLPRLPIRETEKPVVAASAETKPVEQPAAKEEPPPPVVVELPPGTKVTPIVPPPQPTVQAEAPPPKTEETILPTAAAISEKPPMVEASSAINGTPVTVEPEPIVVSTPVIEDSRPSPSNSIAVASQAADSLATVATVTPVSRSRPFYFGVGALLLLVLLLVPKLARKKPTPASLISKSMSRK